MAVLTARFLSRIIDHKATLFKRNVVMYQFQYQNRQMRTRHVIST